MEVYRLRLKPTSFPTDIANINRAKPTNASMLRLPSDNEKPARIAE
jgi:hypothetical protein